jgi:hypothetical protein
MQSVLFYYFSLSASLVRRVSLRLYGCHHISMTRSIGSTLRLSLWWYGPGFARTFDRPGPF